MHGCWSYQRHLVHVHRDCHELCWYGCGVRGIWCCYSGDCSGCAYVGDSYIKRQHAVGGLVDGTGVKWWSSDLSLYRDLLARVVHVYFFDNFVHCHRSRQRDLVHVHGDCYELCWYGCGVGGIWCCYSGDCSGCAYVGDGYVECEWPVGGFLDGSGFHWWRGDFELHGDIESRLVCL